MGSSESKDEVDGAPLTRRSLEQRQSIQTERIERGMALASDNTGGAAKIMKGDQIKGKVKAAEGDSAVDVLKLYGFFLDQQKKTERETKKKMVNAWAKKAYIQKNLQKNAGVANEKGKQTKTSPSVETTPRDIMRRQKTALVIRERSVKSTERRLSTREDMTAALLEIINSSGQGGPVERPLAANPRSARFKTSNALNRKGDEDEEVEDEDEGELIDDDDGEEAEDEDEDLDIPPVRDPVSRQSAGVESRPEVDLESVDDDMDGIITPVIENDLKITSYDKYTFQ